MMTITSIKLCNFTVEQLRAKNAALAAALAAKDEALISLATKKRNDGTYYDCDCAITLALAIQPHTDLVAKIKADERAAMIEELRLLADNDGNVKLWEVE